MATLASAIAAQHPQPRDFVRHGLLPWLCALAVAIIAHFLVEPLFGEYGARVARQAAVYIVAAVSLNVVNGFAGQFSMGHAGFMAVGGYAAAFVTYYGSFFFFGSAEARASPVVLGLELPFTAGHLLLLVGLLFGGCVAAILGLLVGLPSLRLRGDYLAIVTLGFGEIVRVFLELSGPQMLNAAQIRDASASTWAAIPVGGPLGFSGVPAYADTFWVFLAAAVTVLVCARLKRSSTGRALLSVREDEIAARAMGINLTGYKVRGFVFAAFFGGIAGGLLVHTGVVFKPDNAGFQQSFEIIIMVVLGGLGSISGAVLAAILLSTLPEGLRGLPSILPNWMMGTSDGSPPSWNPADYRLVSYALILIVMMLVRPKGLFGIREIWEIWPFRRVAARPTGATPPPKPATEPVSQSKSDGGVL